MKLVSTVLNISSCGFSDNFFNIISRILTQFTQNPPKNIHFKAYKLLTINMLIVNKDQLLISASAINLSCPTFHLKTQVISLRNQVDYRHLGVVNVLR